MKLKRLSAALALAAVASLASFTFADKIELPARGITADTQIVVRADLTAVSADTLEKSKAIIMAMLGDAAKGAEIPKDQWQQVLDSREAMVKAGVEQVIVVLGNFPQGPADTMKPTLLLKLKTGTDPATVEKAMKDVDAANAKRTGNPAELDKISIKALDGDWAYADGDKLSAPDATGDNKNLLSFQSSLGNQEGAPIRLAVQLNDGTKTGLAAQAADPNLPPFAKNLMDGLQSLKTANAGITSGDTLTLKITANFPTPEATAAFKKALDTVMTVLPAMAPPEAQTQITIIAAILTMKPDGATLKSTTDSDQIKAIIKTAAANAPKDPAPTPGPAPAPQN